MRKYKSVCFDLDGTIASYDDGWQGASNIGEPLERGCQLLKECAKKYYIIIYSCRSNPNLNSGYTEGRLAQYIIDWLNKHDLPYDEVYVGPGKPVAIAYVDDRAVPFNKNSNVEQALETIDHLAGE